MLDVLRNLHVEELPIGSLKPYSRNPRTHSPKQVRRLADSIRTFGFTNPILTDDDGVVIAGHGRLEAARVLGMERVPTIRLADMTEAQKRAYALADNRLAENAGWDQELLALELHYISELDIDFDLTVTGFETPEIDLFLNPPDAGDSGDEPDDVPAVDNAKPSITRPGDLWILGEHHLLCADATKRESFERLLEGKHAQMIFTDPPYNLPIAGNVSGLGQIKHREFAMASGEMSEAEFTAFLKTVFGNLVAYSAEGSIHFICMDWRHIGELLAAGRKAYAELKNLCVWAKDKPGMGSLYRSQHELIFVFKNGREPHSNNMQLGRFGRNRSNVWSYPGANTFARAGDAGNLLAVHPTVKPTALIADAMLDCSKRGALVLDSFGGSGSTIVAAEKTGRRAAVMELDAAYVDVAIRRYEKATGNSAMHAATKKTFAELQQERPSENGPSSTDYTDGGT